MSQWEQIVGHDWAVEQLRRALRYDRLGHAFLITGAAGVGKTLLARTLAAALNCADDDPEARPCGRCRACQLIAHDRHPDVRLLEPEVSTRGLGTLKIDQVRELSAELNLAPYEGRRRVAILRRFDLATTHAANAFLKTLEEPPPSVLLLLTALDDTTLPPTIASRCRHIALRPLPASVIAAALMERRGVDERHARLLAHLADGRPGWAFAALDDESVLHVRADQIGQLRAILQADLIGRFRLAESLARQPEALPGLLRQWTGWWRDLLLVSWRQTDGLVNLDYLGSLEALALLWPRSAIAQGLESTGTAIEQLAANGNARLVLECLFMGYPSWQESEAVT